MPVSVLRAAGIDGARGVAVEGVENGDVGGVSEGDVLVIKACDAVGVVGGVQVCSGPGEGVD